MCSHRGGLAQVLALVDEVLATAGPAERAAAVSALAAKAAALAADLAAAPLATARRVPVATAAVQTGVPETDLRRWGRGQDARATWATWPTRRALFVDLEAFDRWLSARARSRDREANERGRRRTKPTLVRPASVTKARVDDETAVKAR